MKDIEFIEEEEAFCLLERAGWKPERLDAKIPLFTNGVPAGYPENPGDYDGEYELVPRSLLKDCDFIVTVRGDSMKDAGIDNGDDVVVKKCEGYDDGDIVVACLDGETTLKTICDLDGETWLVPANDAYKPICLADFQKVYILGKVTSIRKRPMKTPYSAIQKRLKEASRQPRREITESMVGNALGQMAADIKVGRMWFCIYSVLCEPDVGMIQRGDYEGFKALIDRLFPDNYFDVNVRYISVMDVDSFKKGFRLWNEHNSPVQGKRFRDYYRLASDFYDMLMK